MYDTIDVTSAISLDNAAGKEAVLGLQSWHEGEGAVLLCAHFEMAARADNASPALRPSAAPVVVCTDTTWGGYDATSYFNPGYGSSFPGGVAPRENVVAALYPGAWQVLTV